jgi:F420-dependent oxidoreductase-like protein
MTRAEGASPLRIPAPCLVVLIGPSGSGKSTWAAEQFRPSQIVASDDLRALVGEGRHDQRAGQDAFDVLELVLSRRLARKLLTVVDTLGLEESRRRVWIELAHRYGLACHAVVFDADPAVCRRRNRERDRPVPAKVLSAQLKSFAGVAAGIDHEGFDAVHRAGPVAVVPAALHHAPQFSARQKEQPMTLRFGLQIPSFTWSGGPAELADRLGWIAESAEAAGFSSVWVMDHFLQIPVVGPEWHEMLDSYTTLGFLAGRTARVQLGTLVTGVTYRNAAHLAKIVATLDVLSGGRAVCGIGAAWFEREHLAYGWDFPPRRDRYALLEDALQLLRVMWGPGSPPFDGQVLHVAEAMCYPRPLQDHVPILIGGAGERRTLRLVAQYADACNLFGDAATVRHKREVLAAHCDAVGRPLEEIEVTHLSTSLTAAAPDELRRVVDAYRPVSMSPETWSARVNAATVEDQIGRFRELAEAGVDTAIVSLPDVDQPGALATFGQVIAAFAAPAA